MAVMAIITTMKTVGIVMSDDLRKRFAHCPILRETDNRKAAVLNTARE
jgi:hypothetical protein